MNVYKLTNDERQALEALNASRTNILMVVCDYGGTIGCAVVHADCDQSHYAEYRALLGETLDSGRIVEWEESK